MCKCHRKIVDNMQFVAKDECLSREMKTSLYKGMLLPTLSYGTDGQTSHKNIKQTIGGRNWGP